MAVVVGRHGRWETYVEAVIVAPESVEEEMAIHLHVKSVQLPLPLMA
jgi:hypothetical protein